MAIWDKTAVTPVVPMSPAVPNLGTHTGHVPHFRSLLPTVTKTTNVSNFTNTMPFAYVAKMWPESCTIFDQMATFLTLLSRVLGQQSINVTYQAHSSPIYAICCNPSSFLAHLHTYA